MNTDTFQMNKVHLETEICRCQNVIAAVNESTEMPAERKAAYLDYEQPRMAELTSQLVKLNQDYWGCYYGLTGFGNVVGELYK